MNEYRYYVDPYFDDIVWRYTGDDHLGWVQLKGHDGWLESIVREDEDFTLEGIEPASDLPTWVKL